MYSYESTKGDTNVYTKVYTKGNARGANRSPQAASRKNTENDVYTEGNV